MFFIMYTSCSFLTVDPLCQSAQDLSSFALLSLDEPEEKENTQGKVESEEQSSRFQETPLQDTAGNCMYYRIARVVSFLTHWEPQV